jgi:phosphohistidine phosphatase
MKLYLVQHGDAAPGETDAARPLTRKGRRDVQRLGEFLARNGVSVSCIIHSGKLRAQQTAETIASRLPRSAAVEAREGLNPNDPGRAAAQLLLHCDDNTMVVSHRPLLDKLVSRLVTGSKEPALVTFVPGAALCLERGESERWTMAWMVRPELLGR